VSACREQAQIDAPLEAVWELVGNPTRHPEWWPRVIEVRGERFQEGDEYAQVTKGPVARVSTTFSLEQVDDLHEIRMRCQVTGSYAHWKMTPAGEGTFVDVEFGMEPQGLMEQVFDTTAGRLYFRRWLHQSIGALKAALGRDRVQADAG
jgi:carbon monoxide dehydrogenase subunit G